MKKILLIGILILSVLVSGCDLPREDSYCDDCKDECNLVKKAELEEIVCIEYGEDKNKPTYAKRVMLYCNKAFVGCDRNNSTTWSNETGCRVPPVETTRRIKWLPCSGHVQGGDEHCQYNDKQHYEGNIGFINNYAKMYGCDKIVYEWNYEKVCLKKAVVIK